MSVARRKAPPGAGRLRAAPASYLIVGEKGRRPGLLITAVRESSLSIVLFALFRHVHFRTKLCRLAAAK